MNPRLAAVRCLVRVIGGGESLSRALPTSLEALTDSRARALAQELSYGCLRWHGRYTAYLQQLMDKPLKRKDLDIECVLRLGLYQLEQLRTPDYAAVAESVQLAKGLGKRWAARLVNGVLRTYLRQAESLATAIASDAAAHLAQPPWLIARLREAYPEQWEAVCQQLNERPPLCLRVNSMKSTVAAYAERLREAGLGAQPHAFAAQALVLDEPLDVRQLPEFEQGWVSVQDGAAQLAAGLLQCAPGMRVLDACAAPGGKTAHVLEALAGEITLHALDCDAQRMLRVQENLARLGLEAQRVVGDAGAVQHWWDGIPYERILLDAPCSATGVIRRHPDIKLHRREEDIAALSQGQARLLEALWPLLQVGGRLVYATCSILAQENTQVVEHFLAQHPEAEEQKIAAGWGHPCTVGRQILPGEAGMDGFYYACLIKH